MELPSPMLAAAKINKIRFVAKHLRQISTQLSIFGKQKEATCIDRSFSLFEESTKRNQRLEGVTKKKCYLCKTNRKQNCSTRMKWQVCI